MKWCVAAGVACCLLAGIWALRKERQNDSFAAVMPYAVGDRKFFVHSANFGGDVRLRALYVRGISKREIERLLQPRMNTDGFTHNDPQLGLCAPNLWARSDGKTTQMRFVQDARIQGLKDGSVIWEMRPASRSEMLLSRIMHLGHDPIYNDDTMPLGRNLFD